MNEFGCRFVWVDICEEMYLYVKEKEMSVDYKDKDWWKLEKWENNMVFVF